MDSDVQLLNNFLDETEKFKGWIFEWQINPGGRRYNGPCMTECLKTVDAVVVAQTTAANSSKWKMVVGNVHQCIVDAAAA